MKIADIANPSPAAVWRWSRGDFAAACILAFAVFALHAVFRYCAIEPALWEKTAAGVLLRPPEAAVQNLWCAILAAGTWLFGAKTIIKALPWAGFALSGVSAALMYLNLRAMLNMASYLRLKRTKTARRVLAAAAFTGAAAFACANPVWRAGQCFSPAGLATFLTMLATAAFLATLLAGGIKGAYCAAFAIGIIAGDTPWGLALLVLAAAFHVAALKTNLPLLTPLVHPYVREVSKWALSGLFLAGVAISAGASWVFFAAASGPEAAGIAPEAVPVEWMWQYILLAGNASTALGWAEGIAIALLPLAICVSALPRVLNEDSFLGVVTGVATLAAGAIAAMEMCGIGGLWFWTWGGTVSVSSDLLLSVYSMVFASTVSFAAALLGVEGFCRNHHHLAAQRFSEVRGHIEGDEKNLPFVVKRQFIRPLNKMFFVVLPAAFATGLFAGLPQNRVRRAIELTDAFVRETLREAGNAKWIFSEGHFDAALELAAAAEGSKIWTIDITSDTPRQKVLRSRGPLNPEELALARERHGSGKLLQFWIYHEPARLNDCAVQLGLGYFKTLGVDMPPASGVLCRAAGETPEERRAGIERAMALAARFIALSTYGPLRRESNRDLAKAYGLAEWRLARFARYRADEQDRLGNADAAFAEMRLAIELEKHNKLWQTIVDAVERKEHADLLPVSTPLAALHRFLARADFEKARAPAYAVLESDPQNPDANFAIACLLAQHKRYDLALERFARCLVRRPREAAIYNNIAMVQMERGRLDDAMRNALAAEKLIPGSSAVADTIRQIKKRMENREIVES